MPGTGWGIPFATVHGRPLQARPKTQNKKQNPPSLGHAELHPLDGPMRQRHSRTHPQLALQVFQVGLDGLDAQAQRHGDGPGGFARADQAKNLKLPIFENLLPKQEKDYRL